MTRILVTFALSAEGHGLSRRLKEQRKGGSTLEGRLGQIRLSICFVGMKGAELQRVSELLSRTKYDLVISTGFAGALRSLLQPGDFLLGTNFCTPELLSQLGDWPLFEAKGSFVEIATVANAQIKRQLNRCRDGYAVDMESGAVFTLCRELRVPVVTARMISDARDESIPDIFLGGGVSSPGDLWMAARFAVRMLILRERLGRKLVQLISRLNASRFLDEKARAPSSS